MQRRGGYPIVLAATALVLSACVGPTPYAPRDGDYGHAAAEIEDNRFRVSFRANRYTDPDLVELYLLYRAAEVTLDAGYDWFRIVSRDRAGAGDSTAGIEPARYDGGVRFGFGFGHHHGFHYRYHFGFYGYPYAYYRYPYVYRGPVEASAEIRTFRGEKPEDDRNAYDARQVIERLGPRIRRPGERS